MTLSALLGVVALAASTTTEPLGSRYIRTAWTAEDGLPQNSVNAILQTRDGYLWLGTFGGLARFDGVKFTIFNSANTPGMTANRILSLYEDRARNLWIGTETGEVIRFKGAEARTFGASDGLPGGLVWSFCEAQDGALWIGSTKGLTRWQHGRVETFTKADGLAGDRVWSILEDRPGHLWLGTDEGLTEFSNGRGRPRDPLSGLRVVRPAGNGALWLAGQPGVISSVSDRLTYYARPQEVSNQVVRAMTTDRSGNIWAGYFDTGVVSRWESGNPAGAPQSISLAPSGIRAIVVDTEDNIWIGTTGSGLVRLKERRVRVYASEEGLLDDGVHAITDDGAGGIWATTLRGLVHLGASPEHRVTTYRTTRGSYGLYRDRDGVLWVGADGLTTVVDGLTTRYRPPFGSPDDNVYAIARDREGTLWAGTGSGLHAFRDGHAVAYHVADGLPSNDVRAILAGRDGLWIGTVGGLSHFRAGVFTSYTTREGLSNNYVRGVFEDEDGAVWIGTYGGGLDRLKDGRFTHVTTRDGLFDPFISQIVDDGRGRLWMLSNRGIFHVARQALNDFAEGRARSITCISYGVADGMRSSEGSGGSQPSAWRAPDGTLWFATIKGVVAIEPEPERALRPPVVIEDVMLDRETLPSGDGVRIAPGKESLEIHYTGLSFTRPDQIRFRYRLIGLDHNWIEAGSRRVAYYSHVPPGRYTFSVMAADSNGVWNESPATLGVVVVPPFWKQWWFSGLALASGAGILAAVYRRRVEHLRKAHAAQEAFSKQLLASQEHERQRIAAELHDGLGQTLLTIKNRAWVASRSLDEAARRQETLAQVDEIGASAARAIDEVREIAFNLRPYQLDRFGLTKTLQALFTRFSDPAATVFVARVEPIDRLFSKQDEISLYRIVQECINNIVKHARATEATLTVARNGRTVRFEIGDNGRGFEPARVASSDAARPGFGLTGIAERVRMLGGAYAIRSAAGQGATITITLQTAETEHGT